MTDNLTSFQVKLSIDPEADPEGFNGYAVVTVFAPSKTDAIGIAQALFPYADFYEVIQ